MTTRHKIVLLIYMAAALVLSFYAGTKFTQSQTQAEQIDEPARVFIKQQKTQLKIQSSDPEVEIFVDGVRIEPSTD